MSELTRHYSVIQKPVITEKASDGMASRNAYTFRVPRGANKLQIRRAVEALFEVNVLDVNTMRVKGKWRRRGRSIGKTQEWKKAMVVLQEGQTIDVL